MDEKVDLFISLFQGRQDAFGILTGSQPYAVRSPLTARQYRHHLAGRLRLGVYPLLDDGTTRFLALDFDGPSSYEDAWKVLSRAGHFNLPFLWEVSKSGDVHLWLFFSEPVLALDIRRVAALILEEAGIRAEVNPKQSQLSRGNLGNFIFLPLAGKSVRDGKTIFIDAKTGVPYSDQWTVLKNAPKVDRQWISHLIEANSLDRDLQYIPPDPKSGALFTSSPLGSKEAASYLKTPRIFSGNFLPCAIKMLKGVGEGRRDVATFRLAIHYKIKGCSREETERYLQDWNERLNRPPLSREAIKQKVKSAFARDYKAYGCEDPLIIPFCDPICPVKQKMEKERTDGRAGISRQETVSKKEHRVIPHPGIKSGSPRVLPKMSGRPGWRDARSSLGSARSLLHLCHLPKAYLYCTGRGPDTSCR